MGILIILGLADTTGFFKIDNHLSAFQFITLLLGIYALLSIIEVISVARAEKERARNFKDSSVGKKGIVLNDCSPEGTVKIGQEIWKALTASGSTLKKGEEIISVKEEVSYHIEELELVPLNFLNKKIFIEEGKRILDWGKNEK